jgi:ABC-type dipeptide/oligopeptide/nickel transport system ATPase subunit
VLKSVSFTVPAGTKVGVCGRTGSGKSSLVMALLRLNQIVSGDMKVFLHYYAHMCRSFIAIMTAAHYTATTICCCSVTAS